MEEIVNNPLVKTLSNTPIIENIAKKTNKKGPIIVLVFCLLCCISFVIGVVMRMNRKCKVNEHVSDGDCVSCPRGTIRVAGDKVSDGDTTCEPLVKNSDGSGTCNDNFYSDGTSCIACPDNSNSSGILLSDSTSSCTCNNDFYADGNTSCTACPANSSLINDQTISESPSAGIPCICDDNHRWDESSQSCESCPDNSTSTLLGEGDTQCTCDDNYSWDESSNSCIPCPENSTSSGAQAPASSGSEYHYRDKCTCNDNHYWNGYNCTFCPNGFDSEGNPAVGEAVDPEDLDPTTNQYSCIFSPRPEGAPCTSRDICIEGHTCENGTCVLVPITSADCVVLQNERLQPAQGDEPSQCVCKTGYIRDIDEATGEAGNCILCEDNFYSDGSSCLPCPVNSTSTGISADSGTPCTCDDNHYWDGTECTICPNGFDSSNLLTSGPGLTPEGAQDSSVPNSCFQSLREGGAECTYRDICIDGYECNNGGQDIETVPGICTLIPITPEDCVIDPINNLHEVFDETADPPACKCEEGYIRDSVSGNCILCAEDWKASNRNNTHYVCHPCNSGEVKEAGDNIMTAETNGSCTRIQRCYEGQHVLDSTCEDCDIGLTRAAGDRVDGGDTDCVELASGYYWGDTGNPVPCGTPADPHATDYTCSQGEDGQVIISINECEPGYYSDPNDNFQSCTQCNEPDSFFENIAQDNDLVNGEIVGSNTKCNVCSNTGTCRVPKCRDGTYWDGNERRCLNCTAITSANEAALPVCEFRQNSNFLSNSNSVYESEQGNWLTKGNTGMALDCNLRSLTNVEPEYFSAGAPIIPTSKEVFDRFKSDPNSACHNVVTGSGAEITDLQDQSIFNNLETGEESLSTYQTNQKECRIEIYNELLQKEAGKAQWIRSKEINDNITIQDPTRYECGFPCGIDESQGTGATYLKQQGGKSICEPCTNMEEYDTLDKSGFVDMDLTTCHRGWIENKYCKPSYVHVEGSIYDGDPTHDQCISCIGENTLSDLHISGRVPEQQSGSTVTAVVGDEGLPDDTLPLYKCTDPNLNSDGVSEDLKIYSCSPNYKVKVNDSGADTCEWCMGRWTQEASAGGVNKIFTIADENDTNGTVPCPYDWDFTTESKTYSESWIGQETLKNKINISDTHKALVSNDDYHDDILDSFIRYDGQSAILGSYGTERGTGYPGMKVQLNSAQHERCRKEDGCDGGDEADYGNVNNQYPVFDLMKGNALGTTGNFTNKILRNDVSPKWPCPRCQDQVPSAKLYHNTLWEEGKENDSDWDRPGICSTITQGFQHGREWNYNITDDEENKRYINYHASAPQVSSFNSGFNYEDESKWTEAGATNSTTDPENSVANGKPNRNLFEPTYESNRFPTYDGDEPGNNEFDNWEPGLGWTAINKYFWTYPEGEVTSGYTQTDDSPAGTSGNVSCASGQCHDYFMEGDDCGKDEANRGTSACMDTQTMPGGWSQDYDGSFTQGEDGRIFSRLLHGEWVGVTPTGDPSSKTQSDIYPGNLEGRWRKCWSELGHNAQGLDKNFYRGGTNPFFDDNKTGPESSKRWKSVPSCITLPNEGRTRNPDDILYECAKMCYDRSNQSDGGNKCEGFVVTVKNNETLFPPPGRCCLVTRENSGGNWTPSKENLPQSEQQGEIQENDGRPGIDTQFWILGNKDSCPMDPIHKKLDDSITYDSDWYIPKVNPLEEGESRKAPGC